MRVFDTNKEGQLGNMLILSARIFLEMYPSKMRHYDNTGVTILACYLKKKTPLYYNNNIAIVRSYPSIGNSAN